MAGYYVPVTDPNVALVMLVVGLAIILVGNSSGVMSSRSVPEKTDAPKPGER